MGSIVIEQMSRGGSGAQTDLPVPKLDQSIIRTADTTTTTTAENVTLSTATKIISVYAVEKHRFSVATNDTGDSANYLTVNAGERRDIGVDGGEILYYRLDA